jgi:hypothetical protein
MRLLNTSTFEITQFFTEHIPEYAILSHTWGHGEPRFQDMLSGDAEELPGYQKIRYAAQQAQRDGLEYLWVDTICIDKTNNTELSGAINAMFQYYAKARICYAYLADVHRAGDIPNSRWFTRGWTLQVRLLLNYVRSNLTRIQELLAPKSVVFYDATWKSLGLRSDMELLRTLCTAAGISREHRRVLFHSLRPDEWTIADRMSWAARRSTTRPEDLAYCLLGIFNVHMPLLYGEGDGAFLRLQEEIMRTSDDQSLFAWVDKDMVTEAPCGLLARSPAQFADAGSLDKNQWRLSRSAEDREYEPYRMTNQGIHIKLTLIPELADRDNGIYHALLGYGSNIDRPAITVRRLIRNEFARIRANSTSTKEQISRLAYRGSQNRKLIVRQRPPVLQMINSGQVPIWYIDTSQLAYTGITLHDVSPQIAWQPVNSIIQAPEPNSTTSLWFKGRNSWIGNVSFRMRIDDEEQIVHLMGLPDKDNDLNSGRIPYRREDFLCENPQAKSARIVFSADRGMEVNHMTVWARTIRETSMGQNYHNHAPFFTVVLEFQYTRSPWLPKTVVTWYNKHILQLYRGLLFCYYVCVLLAQVIFFHYCLLSISLFTHNKDLYEYGVTVLVYLLPLWSLFPYLLIRVARERYEMNKTWSLRRMIWGVFRNGYKNT